MNIDRLPNISGTDAVHAEKSRASRRRTAGRHSGASLVEVLVVLVIILIGVFAVIQIFPIGFTSLRRSESRLRADRYARNITESLVADPSLLPESITFSYYDANGILRNITNVDPDDLTTYLNDPANKLYFSDVNKFRYIKNEPVRIPLASASNANNGFGSGVGSVHFLTFGPIYMSSTVGDPTKVPGNDGSQELFDSYLKVTSDKLTGVSVDGDNPDVTVYQRYLRGANSYVIDYGDDDNTPKILFPQANKDRTYNVSYTYETNSNDPNDNSQGTTTTVTDQKITVPANTLAWQPLGSRSLQPGSEVVTRDFQRLRSGDGWDAADPYQYKLVSSNVSTNANLGVVAFNPAGANFSVSVPGGVKPFTALVSYAVLDWHILHDDLEYSGGKSLTTSLPNIRAKGDEFVDFTVQGADRNQVYPGLYPQQAIYHPGEPLPGLDANGNEISPDIQVFNLTPDNGTVELLKGGNEGDASADYWIKRNGRSGTYQTGTIYINTGRQPAPRVRSGAKLRILYKAQGDWAVAFQKAASQYKFVATARPVVGGDPNTFSVDYGGAGIADDRIYFQRTELNKGVTATIEMETANGITRLPARQFTITNVEGTDYSYAVASEIAPELLNGNVTGWRVNGTINGASLKTRVIWQDEQNGRNPWRLSDLETFVTRQAQ